MGEHPIALIVEHPERFERGLLKTALIAGAGSPAFGLIAVNLTELWLRRRLLEAPPAMKCPTLLLWGRGDRVVPLADASVLAELIAGSQTEIIEDAGATSRCSSARPSSTGCCSISPKPQSQGHTPADAPRARGPGTR